MQAGGPRCRAVRGRAPRRHLARSRARGGLPRARRRRGVLARARLAGARGRGRWRSRRRKTRAVDDDYLDAITAAFGKVIDAKSPFTAGHSARVAELAHGDWRRDFGMLPARLASCAARPRCTTSASSACRARSSRSRASSTTPNGCMMREHAAHTQRDPWPDRRRSPTSRRSPPRITSGSTARGYPLGLDERQISRETRIITLVRLLRRADRRPAVSRGDAAEQALAIIEGEVGKAVDGDVLCRVAGAG